MDPPYMKVEVKLEPTDSPSPNVAVERINQHCKLPQLRFHPAPLYAPRYAQLQAVPFR